MSSVRNDDEDEIERDPVRYWNSRAQAAGRERRYDEANEFARKANLARGVMSAQAKYGSYLTDPRFKATVAFLDTEDARYKDPVEQILLHEYGIKDRFERARIAPRLAGVNVGDAEGNNMDTVDMDAIDAIVKPSQALLRGGGWRTDEQIAQLSYEDLFMHAMEELRNINMYMSRERLLPAAANYAWHGGLISVPRAMANTIGVFYDTPPAAAPSAFTQLSQMAAARADGPKPLPRPPPQWHRRIIPPPPQPKRKRDEPEAPRIPPPPQRKPSGFFF